MTRIEYSLRILLPALLLAGLAQSAIAAINLTLRDRIAVSSSVVRLGDVAEVASADRAQGRQLAALPLMPAPSPGMQSFLSKPEVADLLAARGYDLREFQIEGANRIAINSLEGRQVEKDAVATSRTTVDQPMNRHAAILASQIGGTPNPAANEAAVAKLRDELNGGIARHVETQSGRIGVWHVACHVPARHLGLLQTATSAVVCQGGREPWIGRQQFWISFTTAQGAVKIPIHADVTASDARVAVAIRAIARGDVITAADVELQPLESAPPIGRRAVIDSLDQLVGMEARQAIPMGAAIFTDLVQSPVLIKRGEEITVVSQSGGIRVRTTARARQDGARGQLVQVESLESKEQYDVRVVGLRQAAVFTATGLTSVPTSAKQIETAKR